MTPEQIAENVKRLREIADNMSKCLEIKSPSPLQPLEVYCNDDRIAFFAGSQTWNAKAFTSYNEAIQTINALVQLVEEMNRHVTRANTVALNVSAKLVTGEKMPSTYPEDYSRRVPKWILREIQTSKEFVHSRGTNLKKLCIDELIDCRKKAAPIAKLAGGI